MLSPVFLHRDLTWVTFRRGDGVEVVDAEHPATESVFTEVTDVQGEYVLTATGHRWRQGTGEEILYVREGRAETAGQRRLRRTEKGHALADRDEWPQRRQA
jgi:hypothetical protein